MRNNDPEQEANIRGGWVGEMAVWFGAGAVVLSVFHFQPWAGSKAWQFFCPASLALYAWSAGCAFVCIRRKEWVRVGEMMPGAGVWAYLAVSVLSCGGASDGARAGVYVLKLCVMLIGGYALFWRAGQTERGRRYLIWAATAAVGIGAGYCVLGRTVWGMKGFGFHENPYKYGTYIGILASFVCVYRMGQNGCRKWGTGVLLFALSAVSVGSAGGWAALGAGWAVGILAGGRESRLRFLAGMVCACLTCGLFWGSSMMEPVRRDFAWKEGDGVDLRQRVLEWQAEINLLERYPVTGTGAGCINTHRSEFYYRLPKRNTMNSFEQNGWIAVCAETGVPGLAAFCGMIAQAFGAVISRRRDGEEGAQRAALMAGMAGMCAAHVFSSVLFHGNLILAAMLLGLAGRKDSQGAEEER